MAGGLVIERDQGGGWTVQTPIPELVVLTLAALTHAAIREWVIVSETDRVDVCEHAFRVIGWAQGEGLILAHQPGWCCARR